MRSRFATYAALAAAVFALSASAIFVKLADAPSGVTAFYRLLFATLALLPVLLLNRENRLEFASLSRRQVLLGMTAGLFLAVHYVMWFESLRFTSVASASVLVALQPLFSIIWGALFLKERLTGRAALGCLIAIAGSFVIGWGDFQISGQALFGDILSIVAAAVISLYYFFGQILRREMRVVPYSVLSYGSSVLFLGLYVLAMGQPFTGYSTNTWLAFLGVAMVSTVGGQMVFNLLLKWLPATVVTMSILGEPIGTCILAFFILGEGISGQQGLGILVMMAGLGLFFFSPKPVETKG